MSGFTPRQVRQLLRPIAVNRVMQDEDGHHHLSQQDVTAHLIRVFGFGSFDTEVLDLQMVFETNHTRADGKPSKRWDVCYRAVVRLTIRDPEGRKVCSYEDGSTATGGNMSRSDAHDVALKSAISLAKKRCAKELGDQFGLSLYNQGQIEPLVIETHVMPRGSVGATGDRDIQALVPRQNNSGDHDKGPIVATPDPDEPAPRGLGGALAARAES